MKKMTSVRIDEKILRKAKEMGINLSQFLEYNLRKYIEMQENEDYEDFREMPRKKRKRKIGCGRRDFQATCFNKQLVTSCSSNPGIELGRLIS